MTTSNSGINWFYSCPLLLLLSSASVALGATRADDYFTSISHVAKLCSSRARLADALLNYAETESSRLERLRQFADTLRSNDGNVSGIEHPVEAYVTIRQMSREWKALLGQCDCTETYQLVAKSAGIRPPAEDDYDGAADALLLRLQDVYRISAAAMARGRLEVNSKNRSGDGEQTDSGPLMLTAEDAIHLATRAFNTSLLSIGMDWARLLLMSDAFPYWTTQRKLNRALDLLQLAAQLPSSQGGSQIGAFLENMWNKTSGNLTGAAAKISSQIKAISNGEKETESYKEICREGSRTNNHSSSLTCRLAVPHPFFTLAPVKEELLNSNPRVTFLYDILTDRESDRLTEVAEPMLQRARVGGGAFTKMRISKSAFLEDEEDWSVERVSRRLGLVTGLNVSDSDPLQLGNYGIGGQYEPHLDSKGVGLAKGNSRLATALLYLNNVKQGGGTVFTRLGLRVQPVKNGALYWHNLRRNSSDIFDTLHAARLPGAGGLQGWSPVAKPSSQLSGMSKAEAAAPPTEAEAEAEGAAAAASGADDNDEDSAWLNVQPSCFADPVGAAVDSGSAAEASVVAAVHQRVRVGSCGRSGILSIGRSHQGDDRDAVDDDAVNVDVANDDDDVIIIIAECSIAGDDEDDETATLGKLPEPPRTCFCMLYADADDDDELPTELAAPGADRPPISCMYFSKLSTGTRTSNIADEADAEDGDDDDGIAISDVQAAAGAVDISELSAPVLAVSSDSESLSCCIVDVADGVGQSPPSFKSAPQSPLGRPTRGAAADPADRGSGGHGGQTERRQLLIGRESNVGSGEAVTSGAAHQLGVVYSRQPPIRQAVLALILLLPVRRGQQAGQPRLQLMLIRCRRPRLCGGGGGELLTQLAHQGEAAKDSGGPVWRHRIGWRPGIRRGHPVGDLVGEDSRLATIDQQKIPRLATIDQQKIPRLATIDKQKIPRLATTDQQKIPRLATIDKQKIPRLATIDQQKIPRLATIDLQKIPRLASIYPPQSIGRSQRGGELFAANVCRSALAHFAAHGEISEQISSHSGVRLPSQTASQNSKSVPAVAAASAAARAQLDAVTGQSAPELQLLATAPASVRSATAAAIELKLHQSELAQFPSRAQQRCYQTEQPRLSAYEPTHFATAGDRSAKAGVAQRRVAADTAAQQVADESSNSSVASRLSKARLNRSTAASASGDVDEAEADADADKEPTGAAQRAVISRHRPKPNAMRPFSKRNRSIFSSSLPTPPPARIGIRNGAAPGADNTRSGAAAGAEIGAAFVRNVARGLPTLSGRINDEVFVGAEIALVNAGLLGPFVPELRIVQVDVGWPGRTFLVRTCSGFLLSNPVTPGLSLQVILRIPVGVVDNNGIGSGQETHLRAREALRLKKVEQTKQFFNIILQRGTGEQYPMLQSQIAKSLAKFALFILQPMRLVNNGHAPFDLAEKFDAHLVSQNAIPAVIPAVSQPVNTFQLIVSQLITALVHSASFNLPAKPSVRIVWPGCPMPSLGLRRRLRVPIVLFNLGRRYVFCPLPGGIIVGQRTPLDQIVGAIVDRLTVQHPVRFDVIRIKQILIFLLLFGSVRPDACRPRRVHHDHFASGQLGSLCFLLCSAPGRSPIS
uniref:P4Hc domain-containing protein n=1 Tax=Macrostomum lignano TaxID=282301 RepID=A0A1I8I0K8_9PLAT